MLNGIIRHGGAKVYLATGATDMRKSIDGLSAIVSHTFALDPFDQSLFVFCNRERNKLRILYWDHNGFWFFYRAWNGAILGSMRRAGGRRDQPQTNEIYSGNAPPTSTLAQSMNASPTGVPF